MAKKFKIRNRSTEFLIFQIEGHEPYEMYLNFTTQFEDGKTTLLFQSNTTHSEIIPPIPEQSHPTNFTPNH